jgi:ABC-type branched-subunit amino acid transport system ATPase component
VALLEVNGVSKHFGGISALDSVSINVDHGEVVGLVGPNGAGKTTLLQCISGLLPPDEGQVSFDGRRIEHLAVHDRCRLGIRRTFQKVELFPGLSVEDHVLLAYRSSRPVGLTLVEDLLGLSGWTDDEKEAASDALGAVGLLDHAKSPVESLDLGRSRLLELARAIVGEPRLLLLDEPSSGLRNRDVEAFAQLVSGLCRSRNVAVAIIEHDLDLVSRLADRLVVLDFGKVIASGETRSVLVDPVVREAYLGSGEARPHRPVAVPRTDTGGPPALSFAHVDASYGPYRALFDVSFNVPPGSVTALLGPNGAGKTTIARIASGLIHPSSGTVSIQGATVQSSRTWKIARMGVTLIPEGRPVFGSLSVEENVELSLGSEKNRARRREAVERAWELFPRLAGRKRQLAGTLSGGEQRILALARVLATPPRLLIADELSLGLAPEITDEVFEALRAVCERGSTLLLIEQQVERALGLADQIVALRSGRVWAVGPTSELADVVRADLVAS